MPPLRARPGTATLLPLLLAAAAAALAAAVLHGDGRPLGLDRLLAGWTAHPPTDRTLVGGLTQLGSGAVLYPALLAACLPRVRRAGAAALAPLLVLAAAQAVESVLTGPLPRPQPGVPVGSISSGHVLAAALGWGLAAGQVPRMRPAAPFVALAAGALVAATRSWLGLHWASDVLIGGLLGLCVLLLALPLLDGPAAPADQGVPTLRSVATTSVRALRAAPVAVAGAARAAATWARTSPWAWSLPAAAALVPLLPLALGPDSRFIDLAVYVGAGGVAGAGGQVYRYATELGLPFTYPPFAALLSEPLARVPFPLVQAGWTAASVVALVGVARTALRPVVDRLGLPLVLAVALVTSPVRSHLTFGQVGLFLVLAVSVDLLRPSGRLPGLGLGLAAAVKLTPVVLLPWLLLSRSWRTLAGAVAWGTGASLAGLAVLWPSTGDYLWRALWDSSRFGSNDWPGNQSVRGMLLRLDAPDVLWPLAVLLLAVVGTAGAVRLERAGRRLAAVGVLAALSVSVSPISWVHHLVWLALPIGALVAADRCRLAAAWVLLLVVPFPSLGKALPDGVLALAVTDVQGLTAVAAVLLLPALVLRAGGATTSTGSRPAS